MRENAPTAVPTLRHWPTSVACTATLCWVITATAITWPIAREWQFLSSDYAQYASGAENLLAGHGYATSLPFYDEHYRLGVLPTPQTVFPPGFSLWIALGMTLGLSADQSALAIALLCYHASAAMIVLLTRRSTTSWWLAASAGAAWYGIAGNWFNIASGMSEMCFILCTLGVAALSTNLAAERSLPENVGAGLAASAAFLVRYVGLFCVATLFFWLALRCALLRSRRSVFDLVLGMAAPAITLGAVFGRNYALVGDFKGGNDLGKSEPLSTVAPRMLRSAGDIVGLDWAGLKQGHLGEMIAAAMVIALVAYVAWLFATRQGRERIWAPSRPGGLIVFSGLYMGLTIAALALLESRTSITFSYRMLLPLAPFAILLAAGTWRQLVSPLPGTLRIGLASGAALAFGLGQWQAYLEFRPIHEKSLAGMRAIERGLSGNLAGQSARGYLVANASLARPLIAYQSQTVGALLGAPVLGLTPRVYTATKWTEAETRQLAQQYHAGHVLFWPQLWKGRGDPRLTFFQALADGRPPVWLTPILQTPDMEIYRIE